MNIRMKRLISALLCVTVIFGFCACSKDSSEPETPVANGSDTGEKKQVSYDTPAQSYQKNETVYVNLAPNGEVKSKIVTDWLHTDKAETYIDDVSDLANIKNVKNDVEPVSGKDGKIRWNMETTDLYYRGTSENELPVDIKINYFLNGKEMSADEIAGKKGQVKITVDINNTSSQTVKINGKDATVYTPFIVAGGCILQEDTFSSLSVENGKTIGDGTKEIALMVGAPGLKESLNLNEEILKQIGDFDFSSNYTITAETNSFELSNMIFAVIPLSAVETGIKNTLPATVGDIKQTLTKVQALVDKFNSLNLNELLGTLFSNTGKLTELTGSISEVTKLYNDNKALINVLEKYMTEENLNKVKKLVDDTKGVDLDEVTRLLSNPVLQIFFKQLPSIVSDIQAVTPITEGLEKDLSDPAVKKALDNLPQTLETLKGLKNQLDNNKELFDTLQKKLDGDTIKSIQSLMTSLNDIIGESFIDEYVSLVDDADDLVQRAQAWIKAGRDYSIFTKADSMAQTSVMFVYETAAVSAPKKEETSAPTEKEKDKSITAWFKKLFNKD